MDQIQLKAVEKGQKLKYRYKGPDQEIEAEVEVTFVDHSWKNMYVQVIDIVSCKGVGREGFKVNSVFIAPVADLYFV